MAEMAHVGKDHAILCSTRHDFIITDRNRVLPDNAALTPTAAAASIPSRNGRTRRKPWLSAFHFQRPSSAVLIPAIWRSTRAHLAQAYTDGHVLFGIHTALIFTCNLATFSRTARHAVLLGRLVLDTTRSSASLTIPRDPCPEPAGR